MGHQLVAVPVRPGGQGQAELADVVGGRDLGGVDPQRRFTRDADHGFGQRAVPGLPVHLRQPGVHQVAGVDPRRDEG